MSSVTLFVFIPLFYTLSIIPISIFKALKTSLKRCLLIQDILTLTRWLWFVFFFINTFSFTPLCFYIVLFSHLTFWASWKYHHDFCDLLLPVVVTIVVVTIVVTVVVVTIHSVKTSGTLNLSLIIQIFTSCFLYTCWLMLLSLPKYVLSRTLSLELSHLISHKYWFHKCL